MKIFSVVEWIFSFVAMFGAGYIAAVLIDEGNDPHMPKRWRRQGYFLLSFALLYAGATFYIGINWWTR